MFEMYNPKYVEEREQKSRTYEKTISILRAANTPEDMSTAEATIFARKMVALGYYTQNKISIGYCAEIAGLEEEFIEFLGENKIDIFRFEDDEELLGDVKNA